MQPVVYKLKQPATPEPINPFEHGMKSALSTLSHGMDAALSYGMKSSPSARPVHPVVQVQPLNNNGQRTNLGTGFIVQTGETWVITARHVVIHRDGRAPNSVEIAAFDGRQQRYFYADSVAFVPRNVNPDADVAVMRLQEQVRSPFEVAPAPEGKEIWVDVQGYQLRPVTIRASLDAPWIELNYVGPGGSSGSPVLLRPDDPSQPSWQVVGVYHGESSGGRLPGKAYALNQQAGVFVIAHCQSALEQATR